MTNERYKENYEKIFGNKTRPETGSWVWHPITMELIPKSEYVRPETLSGPMIMKGIEEFKSPVDGSIISDRSKLREHNRRHGVTNIRDYGDKGYFDRKAGERQAELAGTSRRAKEERVDTIKRAIDQYRR